MKYLVLIIFVCIFCFSGCFSNIKQIEENGSASVYVPKSPRGRVGMDAFLNIAIETQMPKYPEISKNNGTYGTVVADVFTDIKGNVIYVNVLQTPDDYIKEETIVALKQWKLQPSKITGTNQYVPIQSKIVMIFKLNGESAEVILP